MNVISKKKTKVRVFGVQGVAQLINAASILSYLNSHQSGNKELENVLIIYDVSDNKVGGRSSKDVIKELLCIYQWNRVIWWDSVEAFSGYKGNILLFTAHLKKVLRVSNVSEIVLSRYAFNDVGRALSISYPKARRVCIGDSFGLVGDKEFHSLAVLRFDKMIKRGLRLLLDYVYRVKFLRFFHFDAYILTIPIHLPELFKKRHSFAVPERCFLLESTLRASSATKDLNSYIDFLLKKFKGKSLGLILLSNFHLSGMCTERSEYEIYREIIRGVFVEVDILLVKPHPRSDMTMLHMLNEEFGRRVYVLDRKVWVYPIEIMRDLIFSAKLYSIYSTVPLSIKYLYNKEVSLTLKKSIIRKHLRWRAAVYVNWINTHIRRLSA
jgi:hypothetical protein